MSPFAVPGLGVFATEADAQAAIDAANKPRSHHKQEAPSAPDAPEAEPEAQEEGEPS